MTLGIGFKLFGSFGLVLLLLVGVASFGFLKLSEANDTLSEITDVEMQGLQAALEAKLAATVMQREVRQTILAADTAGNAKARANFDAAAADFRKNAESLAKLLQTTEGKAKLATLNKAFDVWVPIVTKISVLGAANDDDGARELLFSDQNVNALAAVNTTLDELVVLKTTRTALVTAQADANGQLSEKIMIGIAALAILLGLGIAFWLSRGIIGGVKQVQLTLTSMTDGCATNLDNALAAMARNDLTVEARPVTKPIEHYGADEIGQTAAVTNTMLGKLQSTMASYEQARASLQQTVGQIQVSADGLAETSAQLGSAAAQTGSGRPAGDHGRPERGQRRPGDQPLRAGDDQRRWPAQPGHRRHRPRRHRPGAPGPDHQRDRHPDGGRHRTGGRQCHPGGGRQPADARPRPSRAARRCARPPPPWPRSSWSSARRPARSASWARSARRSARWSRPSTTSPSRPTCWR